MDYQTYQREFAKRLRNPTRSPLPTDVDARRMRVYEELIFNNFNSFLLACYPISYNILGDDAWQKLAQQAFDEIHSDSPLFRDIPAAFLQWLQDKALKLFPHYPWLWEFMHYEWIELKVQMDDVELNQLSIQSNPISSVNTQVTINPTAQIACYQWPVQTISPDNLNPEKTDQAHCFIVFRNSVDDVKFIELNSLTTQLIQQLQNTPQSNLAVTLKILEKSINSDQDLAQFVLPVLETLRQQEALYLQ